MYSAIVGIFNVLLNVTSSEQFTVSDKNVWHLLLLMTHWHIVILRLKGLVATNSDHHDISKILEVQTNYHHLHVLITTKSTVCVHACVYLWSVLHHPSLLRRRPVCNRT